MSIKSPYYDFDSNTCIVAPLGIISKDRCITLAIVDTQIWKVVYINISFWQSFTSVCTHKTYQIEIGVDQVPYYDFDSNTCIVVLLGIISKDRCITLAIVDTRIWKVLYINISF